MSKYNSVFPLLIDIEDDEIPVFIPVFNQISLLKMTIEQLAGRQNRIVVYDNDSRIDGMREYLEQISSDVDVIFSASNVGPRIFTEDQQIVSLMPERYIVTDPDLIYNSNLPTNYIEEMINIQDEYNLAKVGFALEIFDPSECERFFDHSKVMMWEKYYWDELLGQTSTGDEIYKAWIDTTFSLNSRDRCLLYLLRGYPTYRYSSARIAGKYSCSHVGWWKKELVPQSKEETDFYLSNQKWSHTENFYYKEVK